MKPRRTLLYFSLSIFGLAGVLALGLTTRHTAETAPTSVPAPGTAAMRAAIDPQTGELVTGPEAMRLSGADKGATAELENMLSRSTAGLHEVHHADGRVSVDLQGRFMSASVARIGDDGQVEKRCAVDAAEAEAFLAREDARAAAPETDTNGWEVR
jgi:hypothetical protein